MRAGHVRVMSVFLEVYVEYEPERSTEEEYGEMGVGLRRRCQREWLRMTRTS